MIRSVFKIRFSGFFLALMVVVIALGAAGCGKKTPPRPPAEVSFLE